MGVYTLAGRVEGQLGPYAEVMTCSTSGTAFGPVFGEVGDVDSFLAFCAAPPEGEARSRLERCGVRDVRGLDAADLTRLHTLWLALPRCHDCGERVVMQSADAPDGTPECAECRPACEARGCEARGSERVKTDEVLCPEHAHEYRAAERRADAAEGDQ